MNTTNINAKPPSTLAAGSARTFLVGVLPESGTQRCKRYTVRCHNEDDALQLAFALDGGWGKDRDASDMLELAKAYCHIVKQNYIISIHFVHWIVHD